MEEIVKLGRANALKAQEAMVEQANKKRRPIDISEGDLVLLDTKGLETERPCKKLDDVRLGPYPVEKSLGISYKLRLPDSARIHDTFSPNRLTKTNPKLPPLPGQVNEPPPPVVVNEEEEWEVDDVLDNRYRYGRL